MSPSPLYFPNMKNLNNINLQKNEKTIDTIIDLYTCQSSSHKILET